MGQDKPSRSEFSNALPTVTKEPYESMAQLDCAASHDTGVPNAS